jgi:hypothetical protein
MMMKQWDIGVGRLRPRASTKSFREPSMRVKVKCNVCNKFFRMDYMKVSSIVNKGGPPPPPPKKFPGDILDRKLNIDTEDENFLCLKFSFRGLNSYGYLIKDVYMFRKKT